MDFLSTFFLLSRNITNIFVAVYFSIRGLGHEEERCRKHHWLGNGPPRMYDEKGNNVGHQVNNKVAGPQKCCKTYS